MPAPSATTLANFPLKLGLGKGNTSNNFLVTQETIVSAFVAATQNIWSQEISGTPPLPANTDGVVSKELTLDLEQIGGTYAYRLKLPASELSKLTGITNPFTGSNFASDDFVGHVITERFGAGYFPVIKNSGGTQISTGSESNWVFDPFAGVITQENDTFNLSGGSITCRIYVGKFLNETLGDFENVVISGGGVPQSVLDNLQTQIYSLSGDVALLEQQFEGGYATLSQLAQISGALDTNIDTNTSDITTLQGNVATLQSDVASLSISGGAVLPSDLANLQSQIDTISGDLGTTNDNLDSLTTNVGNNFSQLSGDIVDANADIASNFSLIQQLSASSGSSSTDLTAISAAVDAQLAGLQGQITSNDGDITQLQLDVSSLALSGGAVLPSDLATLQSQINDISASQSSFESTTTASISAVQGDIDTINTSLIGIGNNQSQYATDISTNAGEIADLQSQILDLSGSAASNDFATSQIQALSAELKGDVSVVQGQVDTNDADILQLQTDLASLSISGGAVLPSQIDDLQTQINGISANFDQHVVDNQQQYDTLNASITANAEAIAGVNSDIIDNTNSIALVGSDVTTNTGDIASLFSLVQTLCAEGGVGGGIISGGTGVIGNAEDGSYEDGLFTDFTVNTPVGTAIDRFNEVLKAIVPFPPSLGDMSFTAGESGKLSYELGKRVDGTYALYDGKGINDDISYNAGSDIGGIFDGNDNLSGVLANNISANADGSYPAKCFASGNQGTLRLKVNGSDVHTVDLSVAGAGADQNGNGSGFTLQAADEALFPNSAVGTGIFYREGSWNVVAADLVPGYNYVQVVHDLGASTPTTQTWKLMVDAKGATTPSLVSQTLVYTGGATKKLSGVTYYTSGTFDYDATFDDVYPMTHSSSSITHPTSTNISSTNQSIPSVVTDETDQVVIDETFNLSVGSRILNGSAQLSTRVPKTLSRSTTFGTLTVPNILADNVSTASSNTTENFNEEGYRMYNGGAITTNESYSSGSGGSPYTWNSNNNMSLAGNEQNGLLFYNGGLRSPLQGANGGNFNGLANAPSPNANYSGMGGTLSFYRYFYFGGPLGLANFTLDFDSSGTSFGSSASGNTVLVEAMMPGSGTDYGVWFDCSVDEVSGGIYASQFGNSIPGNWGISFPAGVNTSNTGAILVRVTANASWTGEITRIQVASN